MPSFDVIIVGAGPAGSAAARPLAEAGLRVLILEKATLPRYKTCGGGLLWRAVRHLPDLPPRVVERQCHRAQINFLKSNLSFTTQRDHPIITMTMRADLDHALVQAAQLAGAQLIDGCAVAKLSLSPNTATVHTARGEFQAAFVIAADGATSLIAKQAGWPPCPKTIPAIECEVFHSHFEDFSQCARFDFETVPHGYAWVFPKRAHLSLGVLSTRSGTVNLNRAVDDYLEALGLNCPERIERHGYLIPVRPRPGPLARGRVLLAGDAAGLADPITAEGLSNALLSGHLASTAIQSGNLDPTAVCAAYQKALNKKILPDLRTGRFLAWLLYDQPRFRQWLFTRWGQRLAERMTEIVIGNAPAYKL